MCLRAAYTHFIIFILPRWKTSKMDYGLRKKTTRLQCFVETAVQLTLHFTCLCLFYHIHSTFTAHKHQVHLPAVYQHTVILLAILQIYL